MWTPAALQSEARAWAGDIWRAVESQAKSSTMRLTDTLEEQKLLEEILEWSKPNLPDECRGLHYLLAAPFRYVPYPHGSRFRRAGQREGAFYGAEAVSTVIAEISFYRLLFFAEAPGALLPSAPVEHTMFAVGCSTDLSLNLCVPPLNGDAPLWRHPTEYASCQDLADLARGIGVQVIRYSSVRGPASGMNCALLSAKAFAEKIPKAEQTWHVFPGHYSVRAWCENPRFAVEFRREDFGNDPRLASIPAAIAPRTRPQKSQRQKA